MQHGKLPPIRQLERDDVAAPDAERRQPRRQHVREPVELAIAQAHFLPALRADGDDRGLVGKARDRAVEMVEQRLVAPMAGGRHFGPALRQCVIACHDGFLPNRWDVCCARSY